MKFFSFLMAAVLTCCIALSSCSKSNQSLIDDYRKTSKEFIQAVQAGDEKKVEKLSDEIDKMIDELDKRDLSDKEEAEVLEITFSMAGEVLSSSDIDWDDIDF